MPRMIDVEVLLKNLDWLDEYDYIVFDAVKRTINEVSTVDAVEVIRCKDCWHWYAKDGFCYYMGMGDPQGYCSLGRKSEKDEAKDANVD